MWLFNPKLERSIERINKSTDEIIVCLSKAYAHKNEGEILPSVDE
jgi:hypothetical protein